MVVALNTTQNEPRFQIPEWAQFVFLVMVFLTATGFFTRFGVAPILWVLVYAVVGVRLLLNHSQLVDALTAGWLVLLPPLVAMLSVFWSVDPQTTMKSSFHLMLTTLIGVWLAVSFPLPRIFQALFVAALMGVVASLLNTVVGVIPAFSGHGELIGIFTQKNGMARVIGILAISLFVVATQFRHPLVGFGLMLALVVPIKMAESASALVVYLATLSMALVWLLSQTSREARLSAIFGGVGLILSAFVVLAVFDLDIVNAFLAKLGKDSTMTGRTVIWSIAMQMFEYKPILGIGYNAFWNVSAYSDLMATIQAQGETINGFHNAYLEAVVATGLVGGAIFVVSVAATVLRVLIRYFSDFSIESLGLLFLTASIVVMSLVDIVMYREHDVNQLLIALAFTAAKFSKSASPATADVRDKNHGK